MNIIRNTHKISAIYLFWYVIVFLLIIVDLQIGFLPDFLKNILARYPYQWDFELMFAALFAVWGVFLWRGVQISLFSGYAFCAQGIIMILLGILRPLEMRHLFMDSILWIILGGLLIKQAEHKST